MRIFETLVLILIALLIWNVKIGFTMVTEQLKIRNEILKERKTDC